jgi:peptidoglycan/LPS O-acetylase OafA/YrhL
VGPWTWILGVAGIAAVMRFGGLRTPGLFPVVWQYFVVAVGAALLMLNGLYLPNAFTRFLSWRVWTLFARISYCTYLIQMFVIFLVLGWWPKSALGPGAAAASFYAASAVVMLVASLIAALSYLVFERPLLDYGATVAAKFAPRPSTPEPVARAG